MKRWLTEHFLPMWAKESVLADNRRMKMENEKLCHRIRELESYIAGMQAGLKSVKRIHIHGGGEV